MTFVVDASVVVHAALTRTWTPPLAASRLIAPTLLWSEVAAAIRQLEFRSEITAEDGAAALDWLAGRSLESHPSSDLIGEARLLARSLGWAKTYDAEYIALARRRGCAFVTADARLRASAATLIPVLGPTEVR